MINLQEGEGGGPLSFPLTRLLAEPMLGGDALNKDHSGEGMHMTWLEWRGPPGEGGYTSSPVPSSQGRQVTSPKYDLTPPPPLQDHNQGSLWE